jgi:hypothetical protein
MFHAEAYNQMLASALLDAETRTGELLHEVSIEERRSMGQKITEYQAAFVTFDTFHRAETGTATLPEQKQRPCVWVCFGFVRFWVWVESRSSPNRIQCAYSVFYQFKEEVHGQRNCVAVIWFCLIPAE